MSITLEFDLPGIACAGCKPSVEKLLADFNAEGIQMISYSVYSPNLVKYCATIIVESNLPNEKIEDLICEHLSAYDCKRMDRQIQKKTNIYESTKAAGFSKSDGEKAEQVNKKSKIESQSTIEHLLKGGVGLSFGATLLLLSVFGVVIPPLAMFFITAFCTTLILILGYESYSSALSKLVKARELTMDVLFMVSTLLAIGVSITALFVPGFSSLLDAALLIYGFRHIGKVIEASVKRAVIGDVNFRNRVPPTVKMCDRAEMLQLSNVKKGEIIEISPGEIIPLDGIILEEASVYNDITTGLSFPKLLAKNYPVLAGMKVADKKVKIEVTATEENSYLARMNSAIKNAEESKAPIQERASEILQYFIPSVFVAAIFAGVCIGICYDLPCAIQCVISMWVSACPCTLGMIVPLAIRIGLMKAADPKFGVIFKSGKGLEAAGKIDTVVFDLNGTLTEGLPIISLFTTQEGFSEEVWLPYLYALENKSRHPIAKAICEFAQAKLSRIETIDIEVINAAHNGVCGLIDGNEYRIGNQDFMKASNIDVSCFKNTAHKIFFARGNEIIGHMIWHDPLREDAIAVVKELQAKGKAVHICTGADIETAKAYAVRLNISECNLKANCVALDTANDKLDYIKNLQAKRKKVAMIGDAGNDAIAITGSDLGVAINTAIADLGTLGNAHVIINSLTSLLPAFSIAEQTINNIDQNLALSLCYNVAVLLLASGLLLTVGCSFNPGIGVALMILQMCLVFLNAYRFKESAAEGGEKKSVLEEDGASREYNTVSKDNSLYFKQDPFNQCERKKKATAVAERYENFRRCESRMRAAIQ